MVPRAPRTRTPSRSDISAMDMQDASTTEPPQANPGRSNSITTLVYQIMSEMKYIEHAMKNI